MYCSVYMVHHSMSYVTVLKLRASLNVADTQMLRHILRDHGNDVGLYGIQSLPITCEVMLWLLSYGSKHK